MQLYSRTLEARPIQAVVMVLEMALSVTPLVLINTPSARAWFGSRGVRTNARS
jgi:hypothetical protein